MAENDGRSLVHKMKEDVWGRINKMGEYSIGKYSFGDHAIGGRAYIIGGGTEGRYFGEGSSGRAFIIGDQEGTGRKRICTIADDTD